MPTSITVKPFKYDSESREVYVNGRFVVISGRIRAVMRGPNRGEWRVLVAGGRTIEVFGGREAGGGSNEWFVVLQPDAPAIRATSATDAIRLIESE